MFGGPAAVSGYSIRFESGDSSYLNETMGTGSGQSWTVSWWIKRISVGSEQWMINGSPSGSPGYADSVRFKADNTIQFKIQSKGKDTTTTATYSSTSTWYHIVANYNGPSGACNLYVNGALAASVSAGGSSGGGYINDTSSGNLLDIMRQGNGSNYALGYLALLYKIDNQILDATSFGEDDGGTWSPIDYTGSYGNIGFKITGENSSDFGEDFSGNNNDLTQSGLTSADQSTDTPP